MFDWFLTTPRSKNPYSNPGEIKKEQNDEYDTGSAFLLKKKNTSVHFTTAAPFQEPDEKTITLTEEAALLIPAYNVCSSIAQFPSLDDAKPETRNRNLQK